VLWTLCAGVILAWWFRMRSFFTRRQPQLVGAILVASGMMAFFDSELVYFHEIWAGLLIALALAVWRPGNWVAAAGITLTALMIRETVALFPAVMCGMALIEGRKREALGWVAIVAVLAVAVFFHAEAWARVVRPTDPVTPGWLGLLGPAFFVKTLTVVTALAVFPLAIAAPLVVLTAFGWSGLRDPLSWRVLGLLLVYCALISTFCRVDTYYWALLVAVPLLVGLAFVPDALRDLIVAATDKRRITVRRVTP
jgi:hypothetical protein